MVWARHYNMFTTFERPILLWNQSETVHYKQKNSAPNKPIMKIKKICEVCFVSITSNFYYIQFSSVPEVVILHKEI
jgi:hypothetical protein